MLDNERIFWYIIDTNKNLFEVIIMQRKRRRLVLTNKAKVLLFMLVLSSVYLMITAFTPQPDDAEASYITEQTVLVRTGDTLWEIAKENNPEQKNVRKWVDEIMEYNEMTNATVYPGEKIILPL